MTDRMRSEPAPINATRRIRSAVGSVLLRELESSQRRVADLELQLAAATAGAVGFLALICDRCRKATLSVSSTAELPDPATGWVLERLALESGWRLSRGHVCASCMAADATP